MMGRVRKITRSTDHHREGKARKQVHSPAKTSVFNLLPGFGFFSLVLFFFRFGKQQTIAPYLHTPQEITFSCFLFSTMKNVYLFNLFFSSQIWSFLLPTSVMLLGFRYLSWDRVTRYSDTYCGIIRTSVSFCPRFHSKQLWLFYFDFLICARLWAEVFRGTVTSGFLHWLVTQIQKYNGPCQRLILGTSIWSPVLLSSYEVTQCWFGQLSAKLFPNMVPASWSTSHHPLGMITDRLLACGHTVLDG